MGQDGRWRDRLGQVTEARPGDHALDIAAGTGSITRLLQSRGASVVSVDQSPQMLTLAVRRGATGVVATAETLPFADSTFDVVTFGYLLRYVGDVEGCLAEVCRVLRPGGRAGMLEFGRPDGVWRPLWWLYTRIALPVAGLVAGEGWFRVGRFLGGSIDGFADRYPPETLATLWRRSGFDDVTVHRMSLGGGLVMSGRKR
jgi:demethylmenaquinone methyltransferase/2-methoxy-6-polyprenyl-1,4-benzoquinol methylase